MALGTMYIVELHGTIHKTPTTFYIVYNPYPFRHKTLHVFMGFGVQRIILYYNFLEGFEFQSPFPIIEMDGFFFGGDYM